MGQPYPFSLLKGSERTIAGHMMQLGLLRPFVTREGELFFCPTRLASSLCGGGGMDGGATLSTSADVAGGHVIVETNYRIYAYTSSQVLGFRVSGQGQTLNPKPYAYTSF